MHTLLITSALALTPRTPLAPEPMEALESFAAAKSLSAPQLLVKLKDGKRADAVSNKTTPLVHHDFSELVARAEALSGKAQPDYGTLFLIESDSEGPQLQSAALALGAHEAVEIAWMTPGIVEQPKGPKSDDDDPTESFLKLQKYHMTEHGVGSREGWKLGYTGKGIRISDVEYGVLLTHEDIPAKRFAQEKNTTADDPFSVNHDHGTAVMGIAVAQPDKLGIRGIAYGAEGAIYPVRTKEHGLRYTDALLMACNESKPGDIVMIELQTMAAGAYAPMEVDPAVWMATRTCVDAGVVVIAAAGNGSQDLDGKGLKAWRDRGDSGAILVGAGQGARGSRAAESFSNYGSRVDLQGWGSQVFTIGYGDHVMEGGDPNRAYTAQFGGTSSATPIVAGAAALVQQAATETLGQPLSPDAMRRHLRKTGRKHEGDKRIGELPDVPKAIAQLDQSKARPGNDGDARKRKRKGKQRGANKVASAPEPAQQTGPWWGCATSPAQTMWTLPLLTILGLRRRAPSR